MAEVVRYSNEFLPHVIRLFSPEVQKVDARLSYYRQLFALHQPSPEQACLLVKGRDRLLACAHLVSLERVQPGLVFINFAAEKAGLTPLVWEDLWNQCCDLARGIVEGTPVIRTVISGDVIPDFFQSAGFTTVREQIELQAPLGHLPPIQDTGLTNFQVCSLEEQPGIEQQWRDSFNSGLNTFWDIPLIDSETILRLKKTPGFEPCAFRLGMDGEEPVAAVFYTVIDSHLGSVRINAAATPSAKRSKGYGRRMLKETMNHLEQKGYTSAVIYTDAANQATNLLFKMLGFRPTKIVKIIEAMAPVPLIKTQPDQPQPKTPIIDEVAAADSENAPKKKHDYGFFPGGYHSAFNGKKREE